MPRDDDERDERDEEKPRRKRDDDNDRNERDEDDRPRRKRNDDDDDRPRKSRRRRDDDDTDSEKKSTSILGVFALIGAIGSLLLSFIPCIGAFAIFGGVVSLLKGGLAWFLASRSGGRTGTGVPIASVVVSGLAILIGGAWAGLMYSMKDSTPPVVDDGSPPIVMTAVELDKEYDTNELASDGKYKNKTLEVTGKIKKITKDDKPGKITVELVGIDSDSTVDCHFDKHDKSKEAELAALNVGQQTTIRGTCKGKVRGWVTLDKCSVINEADKTSDPKTGPATDPKKSDPKADPPIAITAEDLDKAYKENAIGADTNYKNKTLEVTGKFVRITRNKPGKVTVEIEGSEFDTIDCDFNASDQGQLGKLAAGDMLVIRGTCRGEVDDTITLNTCTLVKTLAKPSAGPPTIVTADALSKAYESNSVSADAKYKGKYLEISGTVLRVGQRPPNKITVDIGTEDRFMLQCDFLAKDSKTALESVSAGDKIVIRGICRGNASGVVALEECTIPKKDAVPKKNETPKKKP